MKIANKISLSFLITALVLTCIAVPLIYIIVEKNIETAIFSQLEATAQSRAKHIETFLKMQKEKILQLSQSIVLRRFLRADEEDTNYAKNFDTAEKKLDGTEAINKYVHEIFVLNAKGKAVVSSDRRTIGLDRSMDIYFLGAKLGPYIKDAYFSRTTGQPLFAISAPIIDEDTNSLLGVLVARISLDWLNRITAEKTGLGETGETYLINQYSYMITPSRFIKDTPLKLKIDTENARKYFQDVSLPGTKEYLYDPLIYTNYRGATVMGMHIPIPEMNWNLFVEIDESEAFAPLVRLKIIFIIIMIFGIIIMWLAGNVVSRVITRPIRKLHEGAEIIGSGNLDYKVGTDSKDEIGQLSRAFDKMTVDLKNTTTSIDELNKQAAQRKQAEEALQQEKSFSESMVDTAQVIMLVLDTKGRIIRFNPYMEEISGYRLEEVEGKDWASTFLPEGDHGRIHELFQRAVSDIQTRGNVNPIVTKNGQERLIEWHDKTLKDSDGNIAGVLAIGQDITERKRAEERLKENEERYRQIVEDASDIVFRTDDKGYFTFGNPIAAKMAGYSEEEVMGIHFLELIRPDYRDEAAKFYGLQFAKKIKSTYYEYPVVRKDGTELWLGQNAQLIMKDGRIAGFQAVARNITDRKRAEEALQESEQKFKAMSGTANDGIIMLNDEGNVTYWNEAAERIFGYTDQEIMGKNFHSIIVPKRYHEAHKTGFSKFKLTGQGAAVGQTLELMALKKDGTEFHVELSMTSTKLQDKWNAIGLIRDITDRKREEEELRQAQKEAEAASKAKSEFLAGMSHEIRTPMNAIVGVSELLAGTSLYDEQKDYVEMITISANNLLGIINSILDLSKIEADQLELEKTEFNLREIVETTATALVTRAHNKELELLCHLRPDVPKYIMGDPARLRQILVNLAGNAIKFTEKGEIVIGVEVAETKGSEAILHFSVSDTGIGIAKENQEKIFDSFTQEDSSTTRKYGGTGLGLTLSRQFVEKMEGKIWVESEFGKGSTFHFTIPFPIIEKPEEKEEIVSREIKHLRVLIIDDNSTNRLILRETATIWNLLPAEASDGPSALKALELAKGEGNPYKLILLDKNMPEMDGFEVAEKIRQLPGYADVPILMLTSSEEKGDRQRAKEIGISNVLLKPVIRSKLYNSIVQALVVDRKKKEAPEKLTTESRLKGKSLKILLAEDNLINQKLAARLLEKQGWQVTIANNGKEAVVLSEKGKFDMILMDIQMPEMDGLEATEEIRKREETTDKHIPIIALTAHAFEEDKRKCLETGMNAYTTKPIRVQKLFAIIEDIFERFGKNKGGKYEGRDSRTSI